MKQLASVQINHAKFQELTAFTRQAMKRLNVPGVSIGLFVNGDEYTAGLGITSIKNPLPVTPETLFQVASISKIYTATAILILAEQGKLQIDAPVRAYLPQFNVEDQKVAARVTVRHLLNHTAGWTGDYFADTGRGDDALARFIALLADLKQVTPLGEIFTYNNPSVAIAGRVIEVVTGKPFEDALRELIFEPLGMSQACFFPGEAMVHRFAVAHTWDEETQENQIVSPWDFPRCINPIGGLVLNVVDQLRFARLHLESPDSPDLIGSEARQAMQTPVVRGDLGWMGVGWFVTDIDGVRFCWHDGSNDGLNSTLWLAKDYNLAFTMLTNHSNGNLLIKEVTQWVRQQCFGISDEEPATLSLQAKELAEYQARYQNDGVGTFVVSEHDGGIQFTHFPPGQDPSDEHEMGGLPPMQAKFIEVDRFIFNSPPFIGLQGDFLRSQDGKIVWVRFIGRVFKRLQDL